MREPRRIASVASTLALLLALSAPIMAQEADPCSFPSIVAYLESLPAGAAAEIVEGGSLKELASRATGDGLVETGRLDLLRRAFVAFDLGEVTEKDDAIVFNFNSGAMTGGKLSPRLVVHQPVLLAALSQHVEALDDGAAAEKALEDGLGELDDVELLVRWTPASQTPEAQAAELMSTARGLFATAAVAGDENSPDRLAMAIAERVAHATTEIATTVAAERSAEDGGGDGNGDDADADDADADDESDPLLTPMAKVCSGMPHTRELLDELAAEIREQGSELLASLSGSLEAQGFFRLAELLDGAPRWQAEGSYRDRSGAVGPDQAKLSVRYQVGSVRYARFRRWAARQGLAPEDGQTLTAYLDDANRTRPTVSFKLDYARAKAFSVAIPEQSSPFAAEAVDELSAALGVGGYLDRARQRRWLLEAEYENASDDPARQDRFLGTVSAVAKLGPDLAQLVGGSELVVSFVYASKPELRGEVDHDFGLRAGLKWSLSEVSGGQ